MDTQILLNLKEKALKYWKRILLVADRDKFKASMYPDRDWDHALIFFAILVIVFASVSGYLYLDIKSTVPGLSSTSAVASESNAMSGKIRNTVDDISKSETAFEKLVADKTRVTEPGR